MTKESKGTSALSALYKVKDILLRKVRRKLDKLPEEAVHYIEEHTEVTSELIGEYAGSYLSTVLDAYDCDKECLKLLADDTYLPWIEKTLKEDPYYKTEPRPITMEEIVSAVTGGVYKKALAVLEDNKEAIAEVLSLYDAIDQLDVATKEEQDGQG